MAGEYKVHVFENCRHNYRYFFLLTMFTACSDRILAHITQTAWDVNYSSSYADVTNMRLYLVWFCKSGTEFEDEVKRYQIWPSCDRASWYISVVKPTRCTIFEFIEYHSTCFGRSFRPSSGVQDCTHSIRYMSYSLLASSHLTCMTYTWCCV